MIDEFTALSNNELSTAIDDWIKGEQNREIMKRRLIDCIKIEQLAEEFDMSDRNMRYIIQKNKKRLLAKINPE